MITLEQALKIAYENIKLQSTSRMSYLESLGRILAEDVYSDVDMPPFNKSAMDGYACREEDLGKELDLLEIIPAGSAPTKKIGQLQCSKIMTGAQVPEGAETVFMVEQSEVLSNGKVRFTGQKTKSNICYRAEDLQKGDQVLSKGTRIEAQHIAVMASVGYTEVLVYDKPKVGIISTGSELVDAHQKPSWAQIRNSNGSQLIAQLQNMGIKAENYGIVKDDKVETKQTIERSVEENDVTILSGGVSVGDFDYVPLIINELGFTIYFNKLSVKPGKHTTFAVRKENGINKYIIGLPGNPVSSFIQFEIFSRPVIQAMMNFEEKKFYLPVLLSHDFKRRKTDRDEFLPVKLDGLNKVEIINYNGSAHIHAYHDAIGFILVPKGVEFLKEGELVDVRPL